MRLNRTFYKELVRRKRISKKDMLRMYFDHGLNELVMKRVASRCYIPASNIILEQIERFKSGSKRFKVAFSISGVFLEQAKKYAPEVVDAFKALVDTGCVELVEQTYYHSLASLYGPDREEFVEQILEHKFLMKDLFGVEPTVAENTEFLYNNAIARTLNDLGYKAVFTEGVEWVLGWRRPNYVYKAKGCDIRVLMRNYRLSDDIGFRFSSKWWDQYPLTADKYAAWLAATPGDVVCLCMDYETFGEHHPPETGIHEFLRWLPAEVLKYEHLDFCTPSEAVERYPVRGEIDVFEYATISWADLERDTSAWLGNPLQEACYEVVKELGSLVKELNDEEYLKIWRYLQTSDHFYYMCMKGGGPGDVHSYFSPYGSPVEAFVTFYAVLADFEARLMQELTKPRAYALKLLRKVPYAKAFRFYYGFARPSPYYARSLDELLKGIERVPEKSVRFHFDRGDFSKWIREVIGDEVLARRIEKLRAKEPTDVVGELKRLVRRRIRELRKKARRM